MSKRKTKSPVAGDPPDVVFTQTELRLMSKRIGDVTESLDMLTRVQPVHYAYVCALLGMAVRELRGVYAMFDSVALTKMRAAEEVRHG